MVVGFDINSDRITELNNAEDHTLEVSSKSLKRVIVSDSLDLSESNVGLLPSKDVADIASANIFIVTVPTPIDQHKRPNLTPLISASKIVGGVLKPGDIVIYESTVYPGCTEEACVPVLEKTSGLNYNEDFFCGYSPERINPGDKIHTLTKIKKLLPVNS